MRLLRRIFNRKHQEKEQTLEEFLEFLDKTHDFSQDPEEWVARNGHMIGCEDLRGIRLGDKEKEEWINIVYGHLQNGTINELRKRLLTEEEIQQIEKEWENW